MHLFLALCVAVPSVVALSKDAEAATVLHDQFDNSATTITNSQNYESDFDSYDSEAADDFQVPAGTTWTVETIEVSGQYTAGFTPPTGVNVRLYSDATGLPGALVEEWLNVQPTGGFGSPNYSNFSVPLAASPQLGSGHYWISVQANLVAGSHWSWRNRTVTTLSPAAYRNPGGGWETPCETWGQRAASCSGGDIAATDPDQMFALFGTATDANDAPLSLTPPTETQQVGAPHTLSATVRDASGQPVQGADVDFEIVSGPNAGLQQAGMTDATTDANGVATFTYTSNYPSGTHTDTVRACSETGGTENDICDGTEPRDTATVTWQTSTDFGPDCSDGYDNDGDTLFDYPDDRGCGSDTDIGEGGPFRSKVTVSYNREGQRIGFFNGRVSTTTNGPDGCRRQRKVKLVKMGHGTVDRMESDADGSWQSMRFEFGRRSATYFVKVAAKEFTTRGGDAIICRSARSDSLEVRRH